MKIVLAITAGVMVAEAAGGWLAHSLALLADAGHMLADVAALGLALVVTALARRPVTAERTFGLLRLEILAALLNGAALIVIALGVGVEAYRRVRSPGDVQGTLLLIVAGVGLAANAMGTAILHRGHDHSLNQRAAYLHIASDLLGSVGAVLAGAIILATGWVRGRAARGGAGAHPPLGRPRPDRLHPGRGVGARPARMDGHQRGDRNEQSPGGPRPGG